MISERTVVRIKPGVIGEILDGEAVLVVPELEVATVLNEVGAFIWAQAKEGAAVSEIVAQITAQYDAGSERVQEDVITFVQELVTKGVFVVGS